MTVVQTQGDQFLEAGIDLFVYGWILRGDVTNLLEQARAAVIVVPLRILQPLSEVGSSMGSLQGVRLGVSRAGTLHCLGCGWPRDLPLAHSILLLRIEDTRGGLWRAGALG